MLLQEKNNSQPGNDTAPKGDPAPVPGSGSGDNGTDPVMGPSGKLQPQKKDPAPLEGESLTGAEGSTTWTYIWLGLMVALIVFLWQRGHLARFKKHIGECREQLKKCTWPTRAELYQHTVVVMLSTLLLGLFTFVADLAVTELVWGLLLDTETLLFNKGQTG